MHIASEAQSESTIASIHCKPRTLFPAEFREPQTEDWQADAIEGLKKNNKVLLTLLSRCDCELRTRIVFGVWKSVVFFEVSTRRGDISKLLFNEGGIAMDDMEQVRGLTPIAICTHEKTATLEDFAEGRAVTLSEEVRATLRIFSLPSYAMQVASARAGIELVNIKDLPTMFKMARLCKIQAKFMSLIEVVLGTIVPKQFESMLEPLASLLENEQGEKQQLKQNVASLDAKNVELQLLIFEVEALVREAIRTEFAMGSFLSSPGSSADGLEMCTFGAQLHKTLAQALEKLKNTERDARLPVATMVQHIAAEFASGQRGRQPKQAGSATAEASSADLTTGGVVGKFTNEVASGVASAVGFEDGVNKAELTASYAFGKFTNEVTRGVASVVGSKRVSTKRHLLQVVYSGSSPKMLHMVRRAP